MFCGVNGGGCGRAGKRGTIPEMAEPNVDELLAAIRRLPLAARLRLIERIARDASEDTPHPPNVAASLIGLMADEPDVVDEVCALAYQARGAARMRSIDD